MSLIDRYIFEVGRHLPRKNRGDIQAELRSSIQDALDDRYGREPSEGEVIAFLEEFGPPKSVAVSYYPEGQYLIGPALYPLFRMVAGIALAAVIGAQVLAWAIAVFVAHDPISPLDAIAGLVNSLPATFGTVVIVFALLQWFDVRPEFEDESWEPNSLPQIDEMQPVKLGERIFGIIAGMVVLALLVFFPQYIGFISTPGGEFFANPVIPEYIMWISLSLLVNIGLDIYLLWQGRWTMVTRVVKIGANLLSVAVLAMLVQAHSVWLAARNAGGLITSIERFADDVGSGWQLVGMQAFRLAFAVALIVIVVETLITIVRRIQANVRAGLFRDSIPSREG
jgi:hypothetical protein